MKLEEVEYMKLKKKTEKVEQAYDKYKNNKTDENKNNWFKEIRGEINV